MKLLNRLCLALGAAALACSMPAVAHAICAIPSALSSAICSNAANAHALNFFSCCAFIVEDSFCAFGASVLMRSLAVSCRAESLLVLRLARLRQGAAAPVRQ